MRISPLVLFSLLLLHSCKPEDEDTGPDYPYCFENFVGTYIGTERSHGSYYDSLAQAHVNYDTTFADTIVVNYFSETKLMVNGYPYVISCTGPREGGVNLTGGSIWFVNDSLFYSYWAFPMYTSMHDSALEKQ